jgi:hypothetical protein
VLRPAAVTAEGDPMFDTLDGMPLHPLVVHGVVVLLPLAALGAVAIALRPAWRRTYGKVVVGLTAIATVLVYVAIQAGQEFEKGLGIDVKNHQELGERLLWFVLALLVLVVALVVLDSREATTPGAGSGSVVLKVVATLAIVAALATATQTFLVGDSGARKVWCGGEGAPYTCDPGEQ